MKKSIIASLLSVALVLVMVLALVPSTVSAASSNAEVNLPYNNVAPKTDGVLETGEYGLKAIHSVDYSSDEFISAYDTDQSINADFYACWDEDYLYMAWVVYSELDDYYSPDADGNMWEHCCIQFLYTPYNPTGAEELGEGVYSGDYFEGGVTIYEKTVDTKCNWSTAASMQNVGTNDWDFAGTIDDSGDQIVVTYEIRFPWAKSGVAAVGNGVQIGLCYAIADQEDFTNVENNMCEWQDAILGSKQPKNMAVVTLTGKTNEDGEIDNSQTEVSQETGDGNATLVTKPADIDETLIPEDATVLSLVPFDTSITAGSTTIITDLASVNSYNVKWAATAHLRPTDTAGVYEVIEVVWGGGNEISFANEIAEGDIGLAIHGDDSVSAEDITCLNRDALKVLPAGSLVTFMGYDFENKLMANNAVVHFGGTVVEPEVSEPEASEAEPSAEPSEEPSADSSVADTSADVSKADTNDGNTALIIGIVVAVVAVIAIVVVVVVVSKKKKA